MAGKARLAALLALFATGTAIGAGASFTAFDLSGRYTHSFRNGDITGARYTTTDELAIVATSPTRAYFDISLAFFNGHSCGLNGIARREGRALVYREQDPTANRSGRCVLRFWRDGARLRWSDSEGSCHSYCGARGSFTGGGIAWSSRRPLSRAARARIIRTVERDRTSL